MKFIPSDLHRRGIRHLVMHDRAALFAKMGKGKTVISLTAFEQLRIMGDVRAALVVAPMRVAALTWPDEVAKWDHTQHLRVTSLRTPKGMETLRKGAADIYTINYEKLPSFCEEYLSKIAKPAFDLIIFDELTAAKNPKSKRINELRIYLEKITRRWGLTGTPSPNSLLELFAQIRLLDDGQRLGPSFDRFKRTYFYPTDYMEYNWEPFDGAKEKIYSRISDIALTLMEPEDTDALDPEVHDVNVAMPPEAMKHYRTLEKLMILMISEEEKAVAQNAATLVGKMLQVTGGAVYKTEDGMPSRDWLVIHDAKIQALGQLIKHKKNLPMLVACNYQHEQTRILKAFPQACLWPKKASEQKEFLTRWNNKEIPIVVADPRSIGHGLNLQSGGSTVVWFSLPWSREHYDQFNARLVRRGQSEAVQIHRLICPETIDDAVAETLRQRDLGQKELVATLNAYRLMLAQ